MRFDAGTRSNYANYCLLSWLTGRKDVAPALTRRSRLLAAIGFSLILAGCGSDLDCSGQETRGLVNQIVEKEFKRQNAIPAEQPLGSLTLSLLDIVTREKTQGKLNCAAKLRIVTPIDAQRSDTTDIDITYILERTDEGRLHASVRGM